MRSHFFTALGSSAKWSFFGAIALSLAACGGGGSSNVAAPASVVPPVIPPVIVTSVTLAASMTGDQEIPATVTGAFGTGTLALESPSRVLSGSFTVNGMTALDGHVHLGDTGANGPIIVRMTNSGAGTFTVPAGTVLTESQADAFAKGGLYFNAHSTDNPGGEVRGQIGREVFAAQMSSAQEVPANASSATGTGLIDFDPVTKKIAARMTLTGLSATVAHIHTGALGANGPVAFPLTQTAAASGIWVSAPDAVMTDVQIASLKAGGLYFNAHSSSFPNGEIRGQVGLNVKFASLNAGQEVPANSSYASGTGSLVVNPLTRVATGSITLSGMTATVAHIHLGATGANGPVIVPLTATSANVFSVPANTVLTADQFKAYKQGNLYFNAHSATYPAGEIRGQIL